MAADYCTHTDWEGLWEALFYRADNVLLSRSVENPAVIDGLDYPESETDEDQGTEDVEEGCIRYRNQRVSDHCTTRGTKDIGEYDAEDVMRLNVWHGGGLANQLQCNTISRFCHSGKLYQVQHGNLETWNDGRTWLDDRSISTREARPSMGPLNAHRLYEELMKKASVQWLEID